MSGDDGWRVGVVRRLDARAGLVECTGLLRGWLGLRRRVSVRRGEVQAWQGVPLTWQLYHQPSGAALASVRTFMVADLIATDLLSRVPSEALPAELGPGVPEAAKDGARLALGPVLARWACEGDAVISDGLKRAAVAVAAEVPGWGQ